MLCSHVIALCEDRKIDGLQFVDQIYYVDAMLTSYTSQFQPLEHEDYWSASNEQTFIPNDNLLRIKGRKKINTK